MVQFNSLINIALKDWNSIVDASNYSIISPDILSFVYQKEKC